MLKYFSLILSGLLFVQISCLSQEKGIGVNGSAALQNAPADFFNQPDRYLEWQTGNLLDLAEEALIRFPPQNPEPLERRMAMLMLDAAFHDVQATNRPSVQKFHKERTLHALSEMKGIKIKKGIMIWRLYDMSTVIRSKSITVAFDLVRGNSAKSMNFMIPDSTMDQIIRQCDVLFLSHNHKDHVDDWVIQRFIDQGKPVLATTEILQGNPIYKSIVHPSREAGKKQFLTLQSGIKLGYAIYPGHQGDLTDNVTLVSMPEGITVCQTGDEADEEDFSWMDQVGKQFKIDVLIPNCWTPDPLRVAKGYNPRLIIPAHENELGHTIDHREAYALDYSRWNVPYPKLIMAWGESYHYVP